MSDSADYSVMGDFIDNEKIVHYECFKISAKELRHALSSKSEDSKDTYQEKQMCDMSSIEEFRNLLKTIGENVSIKQVSDFLTSNSEVNDNGKLLSLWLENRNAFHLSH